MNDPDDADTIRAATPKYGQIRSAAGDHALIRSVIGRVTDVRLYQSDKAQSGPMRFAPDLQCDQLTATRGAFGTRKWNDLETTRRQLISEESWIDCSARVGADKNEIVGGPFLVSTSAL